MYGLLLSLTKMMILRAVRLPASAWNRKYSILSVTFFYFMLTIIYRYLFRFAFSLFFFPKNVNRFLPNILGMSKSQAGGGVTASREQHSGC